ncbi:MAG: nitroreductase family protein [Candidatus Omnitrophica bacterium]|nr:nitroreductase family protein [Candidatus Omnitrophota bacterium]
MTNPVIEAINKRMSVRAYDSKPIPKNIINAIIAAGNQAPSRGKEEKGSKEFIFQPWRFVVVEDSEFKKKLVKTTLPVWKKFIENMKKSHPEMYEYVMMTYKAMEEPKDMVYYSAPAILFVVGPIGHDVSCALACENIMIAATSFGLGSCYVGFGAMVKGDADIVQTLELKDDERIFGPILLGYPKSDPSALDSIRPEKREPVIKWI